MQFFFFFKQKTAYEIGVRLVGSEMCIRDSTSTKSLNRCTTSAKTIRTCTTRILTLTGHHRRSPGNCVKLCRGGCFTTASGCLGMNVSLRFGRRPFRFRSKASTFVMCGVRAVGRFRLCLRSAKCEPEIKNAPIDSGLFYACGLGLRDDVTGYDCYPVHRAPSLRHR